MTSTTHTLELLVEETRQELASVEAELGAVREQAAALEQRVGVLRQEHASFLAALHRRAPEAKTEPAWSVKSSGTTETEPHSEWQSMTRTDAVLKALAEVEPAGPAEVQKYLTDMGRYDGRDLVSAALAHLKRSGRAWRGGYSQWATKPFPENASGPDDSSGPEVAVTTTGEGGDSFAQNDRDHGDSETDPDHNDRGGAPVGHSH